MEPIYGNVENDKPVENDTLKRPSTNPPVQCNAVGLSLGLLSVFLLAGLIGLGITYAELNTVKANLTERLQISDNMLFSLTEERDLLKVNLTATTKELNRLTDLTERLQISDNKLSSLTEERDQLKSSLTEITKELNRLKNPCPKGWTKVDFSCYFISTESGSWEKGREDCRNRGAELVAIKSNEEQNFLTKMITRDTWIGLNDRDTEGTWIWTDGSPLTQLYWYDPQPDNGNGDGEEDCAHLKAGMKSEANWNDLRCSDSLKWICEKMA